jgi:hypothetical protein
MLPLIDEATFLCPAASQSSGVEHREPRRQRSAVECITKVRNDEKTKNGGSFDRLGCSDCGGGTPTFPFRRFVVSSFRDRSSTSARSAVSAKPIPCRPLSSPAPSSSRDGIDYAPGDGRRPAQSRAPLIWGGVRPGEEKARPRRNSRAGKRVTTQGLSA